MHDMMGRVESGVVLFAVVALAGCTLNEDCTCPPIAGVKLEMSVSSYAALDTVTFDPVDCGTVWSRPSSCSTSPCGIAFIARHGGSCAALLRFRTTTAVHRVDTTWNESEGGCCGSLVSPAVATVTVPDSATK